MVCTDDMLKSTTTGLQPSILYYHSLTAKDTIRGDLTQLGTRGMINKNGLD